VFDHVTIRVADRATSERFYDTVLAPLGIAQTHRGERFTEWDVFSLAQADAEHPATTGLHIGFVAENFDAIEAFWRTGVAAGHRDDGEPGPRPVYSPEYRGAFLLDPDANSVEAARHEGTPGREVIDHLWIRVADIEASRRFYEELAPHAGLRAPRDVEDRVHVNAAGGAFALVAGTPTANLHLAFPAPSNAAVDAFHATMLAAGYQDNGAPGERPAYHPGYYGAFVLDPDGTNVELVCHNR